MEKKQNSHDAWKKQNVQRIIVEIRKDDVLLEQIEDALIAYPDMSKQALIRAALREWMLNHLEK